MGRRHLFDAIQARVGDCKHVNAGLTTVITAQDDGLLAAIAGTAS